MPRSIVELCREHSVSIEVLADRSGLDVTRVTAIVMGRWTPSPAERQKIAEVFTLSIYEIGWGHSTPIQHIYGHGPG
jgi:transcriptional regulator with XRE-family HTH domain